MTSHDVQATLQQRLAALRQSSNPSSSSLTSQPQSRTATNGAKADEEDLSELLASLDTPDDDGEGMQVPIEAKNVDDEVAQYLTSASRLPSTSSLPPIERSKNQRHLESTLSSYESVASSFVSPIEVGFFSPSESSRTVEEDDALIARLKDEVAVEASVSDRGGGVEEGWQKRMDEMKNFRPVTDPEKEKVYTGESLGMAPGLEGLDKLERMKKKKSRAKGRKKGSDSGSDDEETDSDDKTSTEDADEEKDSDEE